jgi:hypothetical protein
MGHLGLFVSTWKWQNTPHEHHGLAFSHVHTYYPRYDANHNLNGVVFFSVIDVSFLSILPLLETRLAFGNFSWQNELLRTSADTCPTEKKRKK